MLNRRAEWFCHIACQVAAVVAFQSIEANSYAQDLPPTPPLASPVRSAAPIPPKPAVLPNMAQAATKLQAQLPSSLGPFAKRNTASRSTSTTLKGKSVRPRQQQTVSDVDDPTDPYIIAEATALGNDAGQIFAFVRDQVKLEIYTGSLRGARGTLWNMAGNSLDRASLLVALLEAAGFSAQYVEGTLTTPQQQQLILSMFVPQSNVLGCPPTGATLADPANDPSLKQQVGDHWWVLYGASGSNPSTALDPNFSAAQPGQVFGTPTNQFTSVPLSVRHTVTFRADVEQYEQASALFGGSGLSTSEVLNETFDTGALVGNPVTFGNFTSASALSAVFSDTTFSYTPYLRVSKDATNPATDTIIPGQAYQENYTNFPLGTNVVTGIFLYMDVNDPSGGQPVVQTYERDILDRIGFAVRQGDASGSVNLPSPPAPAVTDVDLYTTLSFVGPVAMAQINAFQAASNSLESRRLALAAVYPNINFSNPSASDQNTISSATAFTRDSLAVLGGVVSASYTQMTEAARLQVEQTYGLLGYSTSPRLVGVFTSTAGVSAGTATSPVIAVDLRKDDLTFVTPPNQQVNTPFMAAMGLGFLDSLIEANLVIQIMQAQGVANPQPVSAYDVFLQASMANVPILLFGPPNAQDIQSLNLSANAKARIAAAVQLGNAVMVPAQAVSLAGQPTIGWYEIDATTGYTVGVLENGGHQGDTETASIWTLAVNAGIYILKTAGGMLAGFIIGLTLGLAVGILLAFIIKKPLLKRLGDSGPGGMIAILETGGLDLGVTKLITMILVDGELLVEAMDKEFKGFGIGFEWGFAAGLMMMEKMLADPKDPYAPPFVTNLTPIKPPALASGAMLAVGTDTFFSVPLTAGPPVSFPAPIGVELPLVFDATILNPGSATDSFSLNVTPPSGFSELQPPVPASIAAGQTGAMGFCLVPNGNQLPPPGTQLTVNTTVTSITNPSETATVATQFTVPTITGIALVPDPATTSTTAGTATTVSLQIVNVGNANASVSLSSVSDPNLALSGLISPITVNAGQTTTQTLTLTPGTNAAVGTTLTDTVMATYTSAGSTQTSSTAISVTFVAVQAQSAVTAATAASALGRTDIASTLTGLSGAINSVITSCSTTSQQLVLDYIANLTAEMNAPYLANFVTSLNSASAAIAASTCSNITTALNTLSALLSSLDTVLTSPAAYPFEFQLAPSNTAVAQPGQTATFVVYLQNTSTVANTYTLSLGSLPSGVTGGLTQTSVTLNPGQATSGLNLTIAPTASTAISFSLTASINGVSNSARTIQGNLTARSTFLQVQDVIATPAFVNAGTPVDITAHIANVVNQSKTVTVTLNILNSSSTVVAGPFNQTAALSVASLLTAVDFGQIPTTGLANGNYTLAVSVIDPTTTLPIPGGTGTGTLLIGSPVTATLTVTPTTLAPGNGTVTSTLAVSASNVGNGGTPYSLLGSLMTASPAEDVAINGNTAYVCDENEVSIVDITNPANPVLLGTALAGAITNAADFSCAIRPDPITPSQNDLVMLVDATNTYTGNSPSFIAFSLADPLNPTLIASTIVEKRFFRRPFYQGNDLFVATGGVYLSGSYIDGQFGDFVALDVSNFSNPMVVGTLETETNGSVYGGSYETYGPGAIPVNSTTAYMLTSTLTGSNLTDGTGQVWVVNTADPTNMSVVEQLNIPGTTQVAALQIQGNTAVALGNTAGWVNPLPSNGSALGGNVVIAVLDATSPQNPQIVSNTTTAYTFGSGGGETVLGTNLFLFGGIQDSMGNQLVMTVDTTNPASPVVNTYAVPGIFDNLRPVGNLLYAATADHGLQIYSIPGTGGVQYTATVQLPNSGKVAYNPSSFSVTPVITPGANFDTATWTNPGASSITWTSNVTGIQPADVLPVDLGGTVNFVVTAGSGSVKLAQVDINSGQILGLNPGTQTAAPGQLVNYTVTANNPTASSITYNLAVTGVSASWVTLPSSVVVPANSSTPVTLSLRSALADIPGNYGFEVTATSTGVSGSVQGTLVLQGPENIGAQSAVAVALTPAQATAGQGTTANFAVQLTNAGIATDTYNLTATLPTGVTGSFAKTSVQVLPGVSNSVQTILQLTVAAGTAPSAAGFTVTATSASNNAVTGQAAGTLNIVSNGVTVALQPSATTPNSTLQLAITNTGQATDTFNLALGGPAAVNSKLGSSSVTLGAGQSRMVPVTVGAMPFASLGTLSLVASATSQGNTAVSGNALATVTIPAALSVAAAFAPATQGTATPGAVPFLLHVENTGTIQDAYVATITGTTGPIQASLVDITGNSVQTTSLFRLPSVSTGNLVLNALLTGSSSGTVTVKITSQTDNSVSATATATLQYGLIGLPVAVAGKKQNVAIGEYFLLDGSNSYDPSGSHLTYQWSLQSAPAGSSASLASVNVPLPAFRPDLAGAYTLQLIVNNGANDSAPDTVTITAYNVAAVPPNANAGKPANAQRGQPVTVNGSASNDPNHGGQPLAYAWAFTQVPNGSALTGTISDAASATFTPDMDGSYTLTLTVTDGLGASSDTVIITAYDPVVPPNANAGIARRILPNLAVTLDGSGSNDPGNGSQLTYQWRFASGSLADGAIQNATEVEASFTPSAVGQYVARLDVSNSVSSSFNESYVIVGGVCDGNGDGLVNQIDLDLISALIGTHVQPNDPLDPYNSGVINNDDLAFCSGRTSTSGLPALNVSPALLTFSYQIGGPLPPAQTVSVSGNGATTFTVLNLANIPWINIPSSGSTPAKLAVSVNPTGLSAGIYGVQLIVTAPNLASAIIQVQFIVYNPSAFVVIPPSLAFTYQTGQANPAPQTLYVTSQGKQVTLTAAASGGSWLEVAPNITNTPVNLSAQVNPATLAPGSYSAVITLTAPGVPAQTVPVTLTVVPPPPTFAPSGMENAASGLSGAVAPGEIVVLNGAGFAGSGVLTAPTTSSGTLPVKLGGTQVLFDGIAAPLLWLRSNQLSAIVPFEVANKVSTKVVIAFDGVQSQPATIPVTTAFPGLYTADGSGQGEVLAINEDGTVNSASNPAAGGSVVSVYVSGAGQTNPAGVDGLITGTPPPLVAQAVSILVDNQQAKVTYAGDIPQFAAGAVQVNFVVPSGLTPGNASILLTEPGGASTQASVVLAVK